MSANRLSRKAKLKNRDPQKEFSKMMRQREQLRATRRNQTAEKSRMDRASAAAAAPYRLRRGRELYNEVISYGTAGTAGTAAPSAAAESKQMPVADAGADAGAEEKFEIYDFGPILQSWTEESANLLHQYGIDYSESDPFNFLKQQTQRESKSEQEEASAEASESSNARYF